MSSSPCASSGSSRPKKVIILGEEGCGKSSFLLRFSEDRFIEHEELMNIDVYETQIDLGTTSVWLSVETIDSSVVSPSAFEDTTAAIIMISTDQSWTTNNLQFMVADVRSSCQSIPIAIVQSKVDLLDQFLVDKFRCLEQFAKSNKLRLYRSSAKENLNVTEVFVYLGEKALGRKIEPNAFLHSPLPSGRHALGTTTNSLIDDNCLHPTKRRTNGLKGPINKHKCPMM